MPSDKAMRLAKKAAELGPYHVILGSTPTALDLLVADLANLIDAAIDEATADLRTQLAERDAQLATERAMADRLAATLDFVSAHVVHDRVRKFDTLEAYHAHKVTRQPTQDKESS